jgi:hypothetical protein
MENPDRVTWELNEPGFGRVRVTETSCCGAYEWACQGGQFLILRQGRDDRYEETARGSYGEARAVWDRLVQHHEFVIHTPRNAPPTWLGLREPHDPPERRSLEGEQGSPTQEMT